MAQTSQAVVTAPALRVAGDSRGTASTLVGLTPEEELELAMLRSKYNTFDEPPPPGTKFPPAPPPAPPTAPMSRSDLAAPAMTKSLLPNMPKMFKSGASHAVSNGSYAAFDDSDAVSCHARKDLMDIEGGAHMHLLREWKQRELATAKEEAVKAKARYAYISSSANAGSAAEAAAKHEAAVAEQAVEVAAEAVANVMLSGLVPPDKYLMLPDMMGKQRALAATPTPSAPRKFGLRQQLMRATMDLGLTSDLSPSEVRSKASKLVGVCLTVHNTGDSFGEPTLDSSNRRAITAVCNTACTLLVCPRHVLAATAGAERLKLQLEWLRNVPALAMCSPPTLAQLLQAARRRTFAWSEPVVRAGDKGACLYLVMSGELSLSRATSRPPAPAPHTPAPPVLFSPVPQQIGIRPASPPPTTPAYFLAGAADPAKRAADAAGSPKPAAAGVGDSNTPREITLRTIGCGQMVPCIVAGAASLGGAVTLAEGVRFPYTARVASAHAELLLLDGRFLSLVLARQDNGRAIGELTALLQSDARRMEQLAQATEDRWLTELVTAKIIIAPAGAEALEPPAGRLLPDPEAALVVEVARMEAEALEQAHELQVEESRLHRAGLAGESDEALALAWDHVTVAEMARVLSGSWQPHKRPPLISTSIHAVEAPPVPHHRRQPHARMGAAPSHAVHDAIATARRVGAQADNGPLVLQTAEASSRALPTGDASSAGGVRPPRLAATMAPQPSLYGRPVQVDGPGIATALAGTGLRRAPLA
ncbi:hypothetical protein Ctob_008416 [Chrysochromulina tobinii]|uniref:Cyclic nucleotide-binding domain-containing protein n=1 Tax=Chrysochromulina tobinii TaxID=1460289 RepID=A0A0M0KAV3_9EUKA|nr:hypothetical protein Ctob_008416 [Chrysochromulina tobinii]|eukprot:KOO35934.1 hypothetical protein Ctob_008416 [Chrysochromulina sp. CCMP291]